MKYCCCSRTYSLPLMIIILICLFIFGNLRLFFFNYTNDVLQNLGAEGRIRRTKTSSGCPMLRNNKLRHFRSRVFEQGALDIEDLLQLGQTMNTCPYYGSRSMVPAAELVVLPYQSLLSKSSRESLGLNLKNSIVIIDEAHNLADALINMYDAKITLLQVNGFYISLFLTSTLFFKWWPLILHEAK